MKRYMRETVLTLMVVGMLGVSSTHAEIRPNPFAPKTSGTVEGVVKEKGRNFLRVKVEGKEESVRFVPVWSGGAPKDGGGHDKDMLAKIRKVRRGDQVKIGWKFEEHPRVLELEVTQRSEREERD